MLMKDPPDRIEGAPNSAVRRKQKEAGHPAHNLLKPANPADDLATHARVAQG